MGSRIIYPFERDTTALVVAIRNVIIQARRVGTKILVHQRYGRRPIHVVIAIHQNFFLISQCLVQPIHRFLHVGHQEWIVQVAQTGLEESLGFVRRGNASLNKQKTNHRANT